MIQTDLRETIPALLTAECGRAGVKQKELLTGCCSEVDELCWWLWLGLQ